MDPAAFDYAPFYCEENVWRLLARPELAGRRAWAVAVFSRGPSVTVARQRLGQGKEGLVAWDYHVVALLSPDDLTAAEGRAEAVMLDFDSSLGFESQAWSYLEASFPEGGPGAGSVLFRLLPAAEYLTRLSSDRSHMRRADGSWLAPPPPWPHPGGCGEGSWPLAALLSAPAPGAKDGGPGFLFDLEGLRVFLRELEGR